jgi:prepilin-type N-terminal cleavage/methylation domain-containing protein
MTSPRRRGFTLIEVVLVVGAVAMVTGLCAGLLRVLLRLDRVAKSHAVETATVARLARQFRQDVHAGVGPPAGNETEPATKLELALPGGRTVLYEARASTVARSQRLGAAVERRETYNLPYCGDPRFVVRRENGRAWAILQLPQNVGASAGARAALQIEALAGRDRRLDRREERER